MTNLKPGDLVKFKEPTSPSEHEERFLVIEIRGSRVLVEYVCDMRIKPTFVYMQDEITTDKPE